MKNIRLAFMMVVACSGFALSADSTREVVHESKEETTIVNQENTTSPQQAPEPRWSDKAKAKFAEFKHDVTTRWEKFSIKKFFNVSQPEVQKDTSSDIAATAEQPVISTEKSNATEKTDVVVADAASSNNVPVHSNPTQWNVVMAYANEHRPMIVGVVAVTLAAGYFVYQMYAQEEEQEDIKK